MPTLSPRASFWTAAAAAGLTLWSSGAPSVVYPLYEADWSLTATASTVIFGVYCLTLIPVLLIFGNLSDHIGRRPTILLGLTALALGSIVFALAPSFGIVLVGRVLMGVGSGLALSASTAAMIEFGGPERAPRAGAMTTVATSAGLAASLLVGGALIQYGPDKIHLTFWVLLVVVVAVAAFSWFLPRTRDASLGRWRPRALRIPAGLRRVLTAGALGVSTAYVVGSIVLALGAQVGRQLVHSSDALVIGGVMAISAATIGAAGLLARGLRPRLVLSVGPLVLLVGAVVFVGGAASSSLTLFIVGTALIGAAYGLIFTGALGLVAGAAPAHHRAAVISATYLVGYLVQGVVAVALGVLATSLGLLSSIAIGSAVLVVLGAATAVAANPRGGMVPERLVRAPQR